MSETNNDGTTQQGSPDGSASPAGTQDPNGTPGEDPIALARKRQAGAEAARQQAEKEAKELRAKLEQYEAANRTAADKDLADNAKLQERLAAAERRAEEAERKAEGRILDVKYPNARKELPEITDEVRLAKLEALLSDDGVKEPPTPQNPNESNRAAAGDATAQSPKPETSEDIKARLKALGRPDWA